MVVELLVMVHLILELRILAVVQGIWSTGGVGALGIWGSKHWVSDS